MHDCATAYQKNKLECVNQLYSNRGAKNNNNKWLVETVYRNSMNVNYLKALTTIRSVQFFYFIIYSVCVFSPSCSQSQLTEWICFDTYIYNWENWISFQPKVSRTLWIVHRWFREYAIFNFYECNLRLSIPFFSPPFYYHYPVHFMALEFISEEEEEKTRPSASFSPIWCIFHLLYMFYYLFVAALCTWL